MTPLPPEFLHKPLAHRALHDVNDGRPENSRAAIRAAIAHGYGIEIDVQLSADGQAMVFHDYDLKRLTGQKGPLRTRSAQDLSKITLLGGQDEGIPTLSEVLDLVAGRVPLLVEIKDQDGAMGENVGPLERATALALSHYNAPVAVMSFNPNAVAAFARHAPDIPRGLVTCAFKKINWPILPTAVRRHLRPIPDFERLDIGFVSHDARDPHNARLPGIRAAGAAILCWTIRNVSDEAKARRFADNITFEGYLAEPPAA